MFRFCSRPKTRVFVYRGFLCRQPTQNRPTVIFGLCLGWGGGGGSCPKYMFRDILLGLAQQGFLVELSLLCWVQCCSEFDHHKKHMCNPAVARVSMLSGVERQKTKIFCAELRRHRQPSLNRPMNGAHCRDQRFGLHQP